MLYYSQIKREFKFNTWKDGQILFREKKVNEVKLNADSISGYVEDLSVSKTPLRVQIKLQRGTVGETLCACPKHGNGERHCKHISALAIWVVERGSLLRAGVSAGDEGVASDTVEEEENTSSAVPGEPVLYVKGNFQAKGFIGITVESGIRYTDPVTQKIESRPQSLMFKQPEPGLWKSYQGTLVQLPPETLSTENNGESSLEAGGTIGAGGVSGNSQRIDKYRMNYNGQNAIEQLAKLMQSENKDHIVFDENVRINLHPEPLKLTSLSIGKKSDRTRALSYRFELGDLKLTSEDLEALGKLGRLNNQYVWKDDTLYRFETSLSQLYQFANRSGIAAVDDADEPIKLSGFGSISDDKDHPLHPLAAFRLSLELGVSNFKVDDDWTEFHAWKKNFDRKSIPTMPDVEYGFDLREYQKNGLSWLWSLYHRGLAGLLGDDMGLGKTHQVLAYLTTLYTHPSKKGRPQIPSLVVAPTSVISAWMQKLKKYPTGIRWHVFHGSGRKLPKTGEVDLILTTYGILHREADLREREWHTVVLDEAQAIKNASTISSRASRMLKSKFRIAMTGTPVENQSTDLWSLMEFLLPGYLGSLARFKRLYGWGRETPQPQQAQALRRLTSPFMLRRTKSQVLTELPEKTEEIRFCQMTPVQKRAYKDCLESADAEKARNDLEGSGKIDYANILALLTRLKQICDHPRLGDITSGRVKKLSTIDPYQSGKWEAFAELVDEAIGSGLKVVVFTQFLGVMDMIAHYLSEKGIGHTDLRGDTPDRGSRLEKFAAEPDCRVFICSLLAGGLGIDLTAGSVCIHFDRWWNPAKENQATDRLHRYGQTRGVQVFKLQIPGSVEDRIASIIQSKVELSGALIEESSVGLKAFSRQELLDLLTPNQASLNVTEEASTEAELLNEIETEEDRRYREVETYELKKKAKAGGLTREEILKQTQSGLGGLKSKKQRLLDDIDGAFAGDPDTDYEVSI